MMQSKVKNDPGDSQDSSRSAQTTAWEIGSSEKFDSTNSLHGITLD